MNRIEPSELLLSQSVPASVLSSLDVAVLKHRGDMAFELVGETPEWLPRIWPAVKHTGRLYPAKDFLYLEHFIDDALEHWNHAESKWLSSGPWTEVDADGTDWVLEAVALTVNKTQLLLIKFPTTDHSTVRGLLQEGRNQGLEYSRLLKEVNKREVLLHCIVHDLSTPLASIKGSLTLLDEDNHVAPDGTELLQIGLNQVGKMQELIREILSTFARDVEPLLPHVVPASEAPSLLTCVSEVANVMKPVADIERVSMLVETDDVDSTETRVVADSPRLERVIFNLVENAIRHSPEQSEIRLKVEDRGGSVWTGIADQGPGVEADVMPRLFQKFGRGNQHSGKQGLGLYFCRITVEGWGGNIGYEPQKEGGSLFWFELPKPSVAMA
ncbi:MAG: HAMP domain-containing histidine kinase [Rhodothermales bacterium]|nr:HAMP domain-containing histidine kinase [Rhodothermales bacterium]